MRYFEKVSFEEFIKTNKNLNNDVSNEELKEIYDNIKLPCRSTSGSAGYDFFIPTNVTMRSNKKYMIPTGIRAIFPEDEVLQIYIRSSLAIKYGISLLNSVGIVDSDYKNSDNEGHIMVAMENRNFCEYEINSGDKIAQGIFTKYLKVNNDETTSERTGGIGSTGK